MEQSLSQKGIVLTDIYKSNRVNEKSTTQSIIESILDEDLRVNKALEPFFHPDINTSNGTLPFLPRLVQIISVTNIAQPTRRQDQDSFPRLLCIKMTDGYTKAIAIEYEAIKGISAANTYPGSKILLNPPNKNNNNKNPIPIRNGKILLTSKDFVFIGGHVESLYDTWQANKTALKLRFLDIKTGNKGKSIDAPPAFEKSIQAGASKVVMKAKLKSQTVSNTSSSNDASNSDKKGHDNRKSNENKNKTNNSGNGSGNGKGDDKSGGNKNTKDYKSNHKNDNKSGKGSKGHPAPPSSKDHRGKNPPLPPQPQIKGGRGGRGDSGRGYGRDNGRSSRGNEGGRGNNGGRGRDTSRGRGGGRSSSGGRGRGRGRGNYRIGGNQDYDYDNDSNPSSSNFSLANDFPTLGGGPNLSASIASISISNTSNKNNHTNTSGGWNCKSCTFRNHDSMRECEICGTSR